MQKHPKRGILALILAAAICLQPMAFPVAAEAKKVSPKVMLSASTYTYDGKTKNPSVTVKYGNKILNPSEYTVKYSDGRRKVGKYKVKVKLKGKYSGKKTVSFKIFPASTNITSANASTEKQQITVKWKKQTTEVTGYKIQYSTDKNFKSGVTTVRVRTADKEYAVLKKGIKAGKTYYIRIRTYKKAKDKKYYSNWTVYSKGVSSGPVKSSKTTSTSTGHGFSSATEAIVKAHMNDFNYRTFDSFMSTHGGAEKYVRSLGGVFSKWCGVQGNVKTAGEFQEVAEYVMGIMTIWGPDYRGGGGRHEFNANYGKGNQYGRFYSGMSVSHNWRCKPLETVYFRDKNHIMTDCGCGAYYILQKAGLYYKYAGVTYSSTARRKFDSAIGGTVVFKKEDLQVGDILQMSKTRSESGWKHVCIVGEVHQDGRIITYDTGNRFVNTANYKKEFIVNANGTLGGDYKGYKSWFGMRMRALDQSDAKNTK